MTKRERWMLSVCSAVLGMVLIGPSLLAQLSTSGGIVLGAGSAVIGHIIADASSAVIGHVVVDTAPSTAVTNAGTFAVQDTLQAGSAIVGKVGIDQTSDGTTNKVYVGNIPHAVIDTGSTTAVTQATGTNLHAVIDSGSTTAATQSGTWTVQPGNTANTTAWLVKSVPSTTCGTTAVSQALAAVPTSATAVFSATTCLFTVFFENSNAGAQTVTLTDNAGTPLNAVGPAFSIPGLSNLVVNLGGSPFSSGVKWTAGGSGVLGSMVGYQ